MINYSDYKADDFLTDENFRKWVYKGSFKNPHEPISQWFVRNPDHKNEALIARDIILATSVAEEPFPDGYFEKVSDETLRAIRVKKGSLRFPAWVWRAAASVVLMSGIAGWYVWQQKESSIGLTKIQVPSVQQESRLESVNNTKSVLPVALPDGSSVLLYPESSLSYSRKAGGNREVVFTGKAFFEVARDSSSPFVVYSGEMVTKVLGTSFTITAYDRDKDFSVVVKTGKVAVSSAKGLTKAPESAQEIINIVPNQQLVFNRETARFQKKEIEIKEMLKYVPPTSASYVFEDSPVADVFNQIAAAYGLKIDYDPNVFLECELTTNLADEPLFEKLHIVCNAIGPETSYVVENGHIRVISNGCNQ